MPFDTANIVPGKPVLGRHIVDLYAGLTGQITDQPITLGSTLTVGGVTTLNLGQLFLDPLHRTGFGSDGNAAELFTPGEMMLSSGNLIADVDTSISLRYASSERVLVNAAGMVVKSTLEVTSDLTADQNLMVWGVTTLGANPVQPMEAATKQYADGLITTHLAAPDPHPQYLTQTEGNALYAPVAGGYLTPGQADLAYVNVTGDTMTGSLLFSPDITHSIGASGANRPLSVYAANLYLGARGWLSDGTGTSVRIYNLTNGSTFLFDATTVFQPSSNLIEQRNGTNAQTLRIYNTYTDGSNYARTTIGPNTGTSGNPGIIMDRAGTGPAHHLYVGTGTGGGHLMVFTGGAERWIFVGGTGTLLAAADNTVDIGSSAGSRPRNLYAGTSVVTPLVVTPWLSPASNIVEQKSQTQGAGPQTWRLYNSWDGGGNNEWLEIGWSSNSLIIQTRGQGTGVVRPFVFSNTLLFGTDNTYDIGATTSGRPRTIYAGTSVVTPKISVDTIALGQASSDVFLVRDAVGTLALRNGTAPQFLQVYNTYTDSLNYERMLMGTTGGGAPTISYQAAGTGSTVRLFRIQGTGGIAMSPAGTDTWFFGTSGGLAPAVDNAYDIGAPATRVRTVYANDISVTAGTTSAPQINADVFGLGQSSPDIFLVRESFGVLAQRNGTNNQTFRWYGSYTDSLNYDRIGLWFSGTVALFLTEQAGTGVARELRLGTSSTQPVMLQTNSNIRWLVNSTGNLLAYVDNTYDIGAAGVSRPRTIYAGTSVVTPMVDTPLLQPAGNVVEQRNGTTGQAFYLYRTYTDASNYERVAFQWSANDAILHAQAAGTGVGRDLYVGTHVGAGSLIFRVNAGNYWQLNGTGGPGGIAHITPRFDNVLDIGHPTMRVRTIYAGTSFIGPGAVPAGGTAGQALTKNSASSYDVAWTTVGVAWPLLAPGGTAAAPSYSFANATGMGFYERFGVATTLAFSGLARVDLQGSFVNLSSGMYLGWSSGTDPTAAVADTVLLRDAANILAQRNGVNAQALRVYGTYTDASNYERLSIDWSTNIAWFRTQNLGTGVQRRMIFDTADYEFRTAGVARWGINAGGVLFSVTDGSMIIGTSTGYRPGAINVLGGVISWNPGAGILNDATNYEKVSLTWVSNRAEIMTQAGGTGVARHLYIGSRSAGDLTVMLNSVDAWAFKWNGGALVCNTDNVYDIGYGGANRPRDLNLARNVVLGNQVLGPANIAYSHAANTGTGFGSVNPATHTATWVNGATVMRFETGAIRIGSAIGLGWSSATDANGAGNDAVLYRGGAGVIEQRNGTAAQSFILYNTYTNAVNYERLAIYWTANQAVIRTEGTGTGVSRPLYLGSLGTSPVHLYADGQIRWTVDPGGHLLAGSDDVWDIGAVAASRPRNVYTSRGFIGPGSVPTGGTTGQVLQKNSATNYDVGWVIVAGGVTLPLGQHLTFAPDNTYDIGANAANRPRDLWLGRDLQAAIGSSFLGRTGVMGGTDPSYALRVTGNTYFGGDITFVNMSSTGSASFGGPVTGQYLVTGGDIRTTSAVNITISPNNTQRWVYQSSDGAFRPTTDNAVDIGLPAATRPRNIYQSGGIFQSYNPGAGIINDGTNYERLSLWWSANAAYLLTEQGGTGVTRSLTVGTQGAADMYLRTSGSNRWQISATGHLLAVNDLTNDIGANGASRPRDLYVGRDLNVTRLARFFETIAIGTTSPTGTTGLYLYRPNISGLSSLYGMRNEVTFTSSATTAGYVYHGVFDTQAAAFTMATGAVFYAAPIFPGSGSTITNLYGLYVANLPGLAGVTNAYGVYIANQAGAATTNIGLHNDGVTRLNNALIWQTDNTRDIGASGATRPRTIYAATSVVTPALVVSAAGAFVSGDKYLVVDASGNIHKSATGPAS